MFSSSSSITIDQSSRSSSTQPTLSHHGFKKSSKLNEKDVDNMKKLCVQWVRKYIRSFSIVDDSGFRSVTQELIRIGMLLCFNLARSNNTLSRLGHTYGVIDVNEVLRSRHTIACRIYDVTDTYREYIKQKLIEPLKHRAVTICPDFRTDAHKNISYLGLSLTYIDAHYQFFSIDLFCRPYVGVKSGDLIVKVSDLRAN